MRKEGVSQAIIERFQNLHFTPRLAVLGGIYGIFIGASVLNSAECIISSSTFVPDYACDNEVGLGSFAATGLTAAEAVAVYYGTSLTNLKGGYRFARRIVSTALQGRS